jgi:hypothetical protein
VLHLLQPAARLTGRLQHGLTPWRRRGRALHWLAPRARQWTVWSERWRAPSDRLSLVEEVLRRAGWRVRRGGDFDGWDLEVRSGALGGARLLAATEEHGAGRQLTRLRAWPRLSPGGLAAVAVLAGLAGGAFAEGARMVAVVLASAALAGTWRALWECGTAAAGFASAIGVLERHEGAAARAAERARLTEHRSA